MNLQQGTNKIKGSRKHLKYLIFFSNHVYRCTTLNVSQLLLNPVGA